MSDLPVLLPVSSIDPYPRNPRRFSDSAFEERLTGVLKERGEFDPAYAIIVRPKAEDRYEALGGDRRLRSTKRAGLSHIWCWIRNPATDEEAFDIAVESNNQEGLSKLELALVALELERAPGRAGQGITAFAREHGVEGSLGRYQKGARFFQWLEGRTSENVLQACRDRAEHLARIADAPDDRKVELVEQLVSKDWSIRETERAVKAANSAASGAKDPAHPILLRMQSDPKFAAIIAGFTDPKSMGSVDDSVAIPEKAVGKYPELGEFKNLGALRRFLALSLPARRSKQKRVPRADPSAVSSPTDQSGSPGPAASTDTTATDDAPDSGTRQVTANVVAFRENLTALCGTFSLLPDDFLDLVRLHQAGATIEEFLEALGMRALRHEMQRRYDALPKKNTKDASQLRKEMNSADSAFRAFVTNIEKRAKG